MRKPNSAELTMRDPALAAIMGALPGPNFGATRRGPVRARSSGGADFGFGFGDEAGADVGYGSYAGDAGADAGFGAPHKHHGKHPHHGHHHPHIDAHARMLAETRHRMRLLDPNGDSKVKVEGYSFPFGQNVTLGTAAGISATLQPNAMIKPKRVVMNAPAPGFVTIASLLIANVNAILGTNDDAFTYSPLAQGIFNDLPLLDMSTRASVSGTYTGFVPAGYANGFVFPFTVTLVGPAVLAGNAPPGV